MPGIPNGFAVARACRQEFQFANNKFEQPTAPGSRRWRVGVSWLPCLSEHSLLRNKYNSQQQFAFRLVCLAATRTATDSLAADNAID